MRWVYRSDMSGDRFTAQTNLEAEYLQLDHTAALIIWQSLLESG